MSDRSRMYAHCRARAATGPGQNMVDLWLILGGGLPKIVAGKDIDACGVIHPDQLVKGQDTLPKIREP